MNFFADLDSGKIMLIRPDPVPDPQQWAEPNAMKNKIKLKCSQNKF